MFCTDTSIDSENGKPVVRRGRKATGPNGSAGLPNERETTMKVNRTTLGEGLRWLALAALPSDVRAGGDAVDWLLDDPIFTPAARRMKRPVGRGLGSAVPAHP
jgi:hypothetical protein